jgi:hypothetical protein
LSANAHTTPTLYSATGSGILLADEALGRVAVRAFPGSVLWVLVNG